MSLGKRLLTKIIHISIIILFLSCLFLIQVIENPSVLKEMGEPSKLEYVTVAVLVIGAFGINHLFTHGFVF